MKRRQAPVSQPHSLQQKQILQSILKYVPLREAARSARVSRSWRNATQEGLKFHPGRPEFCRNLHGSWALYIENKDEVVGRFIPVDDIREPRRSHLLEITNTMSFNHEETWSLTNLTQAPSNLKSLDFFESALPTQEEVLEFCAKVDLSQIEVIGIDMPLVASNGVELIINALPSLKKIDVCHTFHVHIDFRRVEKAIETLRSWATQEIPNLDGKVKILELRHYGYDNKPIQALNLENIYGVEKIVWDIIEVRDEILEVDVNVEDFIEAHCEEVREKLIHAVGTPFKTFIIDCQDLLWIRNIEKYFELHVTENWDFSLENSQLVFKQIEK